MSMVRQVKKCLANQETFKGFNAFISLSKDINAIKATAQSADDRRSRGQPKSDIDGQLIAIKDNICTVDEPTTCASKILDGFVSPYSATVVEKLRAAGAIVAGKANLDEFGMGSHSTFSYFKPVHYTNGARIGPLSAGGSSGGSAVAVASGQCFAALGTDTGGSVRLPAAYTGTVGFKPSYGLVSRHGVVAYANSLDTVGIIAPKSNIAKQVFGNDNHIHRLPGSGTDRLLEVIKGHDSRDPTSLPLTTRARIEEQLSSRNLKRAIRIGVPFEYNTMELEPTIRTAWLHTLETLQKHGHSIHQVSLPTTKKALSAYYIIAPAEASSNLAKFDGVRYGQHVANNSHSGNVLYAASRGKGLGEEVQQRILLGSYSLSASAIDNYFLQAQRIRRLVQQDFDDIFMLRNLLSSQNLHPPNVHGVDVLVFPTAPSEPPKLADVIHQSSVDAYSDDVLTVPASLAGLPAISVPVQNGDANSLEGIGGGDEAVGMQIVAQFGDDGMVFHVAEILERTCGRLSVR